MVRERIWKKYKNANKTASSKSKVSGKRKKSSGIKCKSKNKTVSKTVKGVSSAKK